ncbi:MAG: hypothetical protein PF517_06900 [Salinivirgaceae bacterium]|jgi:hypothetical protein|nr:hypothetical protein [Salinivirgaceae bacterium]
MKYFCFIYLLFLASATFSQTRDKQYAIYSTLGVKGGIGVSSIYNATMTADQNVLYKSGLYSALGIKTSLSYISKSTVNTLFGIHADYLWGRYPIIFDKIMTDMDVYRKTVVSSN